MSERRADLHIHTYYSDGTQSPAEVVSEAAACGLAAIAITDHDTLDGVAEAVTAGQSLGVEVITGVELSSDFSGKDIHILGYLFGLSDNPLLEKLSLIQSGRVERMRKMIDKLISLGIKDISFDEVSGQVHSDAVGRLHLAKLLVQKGHVASLDMAFTRYLGEGAQAYFPKYQQTPYEAIRLIKDSGGLAVLAHPMLTRKDELIRGMVAAGLDGIECYYPNCSPAVTGFYLNLTAKYGLLATGGSDAHGRGKSSTWISKAYVDFSVVEKMKQRLTAS